MTGLLPAFGNADPKNCDREPIHTPGSIQPHGVLLTFHPGTLKVVQVAEDTGCLLAAEEVRGAAGFDRVMVYQFLSGESGVVITGAKSEELEPYLGLHYPASDIPQHARALYLRRSAGGSKTAKASADLRGEARRTTGCAAGPAGIWRVLLERSLAYDLGGDVDRPEGLICTAMIPIDQIVKGEECYGAPK